MNNQEHTQIVLEPYTVPRTMPKTQIGKLKSQSHFQIMSNGLHQDATII